MNLKNKLERYLRVTLLGPGSRLIKKIIYRAAVSQRLRNTVLNDIRYVVKNLSNYVIIQCHSMTSVLPSTDGVVKQICD